MGWRWKIASGSILSVRRSDILAPEGWKNGLSFVTGWMATAGWVSLAATGSSLGANFIVG
jgi:hypothetical protein